MGRPASLWVLRIVLGMVVFGAGLGKALDMPGFIAVLETYRFGLPLWANWAGSLGVVVFELALGLWILSGRALPAAGMFSVAMHAGYFALLGSALARGLDLPNCGCFGVFLPRRLTWYSPLEDLALIAVSVCMIWLARGNSPRTAPSRTEGEIGA